MVCWRAVRNFLLLYTLFIHLFIYLINCLFITCPVKKEILSRSQFGHSDSNIKTPNNSFIVCHDLKYCPPFFVYSVYILFVIVILYS